MACLTTFLTVSITVEIFASVLFASATILNATSACSGSTFEGISSTIFLYFLTVSGVVTFSSLAIFEALKSFLATEANNVALVASLKLLAGSSKSTFVSTLLKPKNVATFFAASSSFNVVFFSSTCAIIVVTGVTLRVELPAGSTIIPTVSPVALSTPPFAMILAVLLNSLFGKVKCPLLSVIVVGSPVV